MATLLKKGYGFDENKNVELLTVEFYSGLSKLSTGEMTDTVSPAKLLEFGIEEITDWAVSAFSVMDRHSYLWKQVPFDMANAPYPLYSIYPQFYFHSSTGLFVSYTDESIDKDDSAIYKIELIKIKTSHLPFPS